MTRANYLPVPGFYNLNHACLVLHEAFGVCTYLVGSSIEKRDWRDVDVRTILSDEAYEKLFQGLSGSPSANAFWSLLSTAISEWLSARTGLPIDYQIQKQSEANAEHKGPRHALGIFYQPMPAAKGAA